MTHWIKIEPVFWNPENENDEIEGKLMRKEDSFGAYKTKAYFLETSTGNELIVGGTTVLDDKMSLVEIGDKIKIVYKGKKQGEHAEYKIFEVFKEKKESEERGN